MAAIACPDLPTLKRLTLGKMSPSEVEQLALHCESCERCVQAISQLHEADLLVELLSSKNALPNDTPLPDVQALIGRLKALRPFAEGTLSGTTDATPTGEEGKASRPSLTEQTEQILAVLAPAGTPNEIGRLGDYRIKKILSQGGMGVVFLAEDVNLQRTVALKVIRPDYAHKPDARTRFLREAKAVARLEHDHIVPIYQIGEDRGVPFIAMPLLTGESLAERLKRGDALPLSEILRVGKETARGLAAAHERGLVHRDIKPANLWLDANAGDRVRILDFGLARLEAAGGDEQVTLSGVIVGTPSFMAPEQAQNNKNVDARADLFSLGVVLYRLCTGELPFRGSDTMSMLFALATQEPTPPIACNPNLPSGLSELVMKLLAKDPARRPASAREVIQALERIETSPAAEKRSPAEKPRTQEMEASPAFRPFTADSQTAALPVSKRPPNRKRTALLWAAVVTGFLALAGAAAVYYWETPKGTVRIEINSDDIEVVFSKNGPVIKGAAGKQDIKLDPGEHGLKIRHGDLEFETDTFLLKKGGQITLRIELLKGKIRAEQDGRLIGEKPLKDRAVVAAPKEKQKDVGVVPKEKPKDQEPPKAPARLIERIIPDPRVPVLAGGEDLVWGVRFFPDGERVLGASWDGKVRLWNVKTGKLLDTYITNHTEKLLNCLDVSPDGRHFAAGGSFAGVFLWQEGRLTPKKLMPIPKKPAVVKAVAFTPDSQHLVAAANNGSLYVFQVDTGKMIQQHQVFTDKAIVGLCLHPDGTRAVCHSVTDTVLWDLKAGKQIHHFPGKFRAEGLAFSRDGKRVFVGGAGGKIWIFDTETAKEVGSLLGHKVQVMSLHHLEGDLLVSSGQDRTVRLWNLKTGKEIDRVTSKEYVLHMSAVSPDGRRLVAGGGWRVFQTLERFHDGSLRQFLLLPAQE